MIESQKDTINNHSLKSPGSLLQRELIESQKNTMNSHPQESLCFKKISSKILKRKTNPEKREKKSPWIAFLFCSFIRGGFLKALLGLASFTFVFSAQANIGGTDLQNFNPTINGLDFVTVHSTRTLKPYQMNFGAFLNYITNSLPLDKTRLGFKDTQKLTDPNDLLLYSNLHFAVGVLSNWEMGFSIGSVNSQDIKNNTKDNFLFSYNNTGLNDIRFHSKLRFIEQKKFSVAAVGSIDFERIKQNPFSGEKPGASFQLEGVADMQIDSHFLWAVNLGYRFRQKGAPLWQNTGDVKEKNKGKDALLSNQILYSSAISYATDDNGSAIIGEIYGGYFTEQQSNFPSDRQLNTLEALAGYRLSSIQNFDLHLGAGTKFYKGFGSPDFRVYVGFNWRADELSKALGLKIDNTQPSPRSMRRRKKDRTKQENQRMDYRQENPRTDDYRQENQRTDDYKQENKRMDDYRQDNQKMDYKMEKEGKGYDLEEQVEPFYGEENAPSNSFSEPGMDSSPLQKNSNDSDNDGVEDYLDRCLKTPPGVQVDIYGCRPEPPGQ